MRSTRARLTAGIIALGLLLTSPCGAQEQTVTPATFATFAVRGSDRALPHEGTLVSGIDPGFSVDVVGELEVLQGDLFGYLRTADGALTAIKAPGESVLCSYLAVNAFGSIGGFFQNSLREFRGFGRSPTGSFTIFNLPDHVRVCCTSPAINRKGAIITSYNPAREPLYLGFLREPDGSQTSFSVPNAELTIPMGINVGGTIVGKYFPPSSCCAIGHGFVRTPDGVVTKSEGLARSFPTSINDLGEIAGSYYDKNNRSHGFLRSPQGSFTTFNVPGAEETYVEALDPSGNIAGYYIVDTTDFVPHGYLRSRDGAITGFDVPGSKKWTMPVGINSRCVIAGEYLDASGRFRGFLRFPAGGSTSATGAGRICR